MEGKLASSIWRSKDGMWYWRLDRLNGKGEPIWIEDRLGHRVYRGRIASGSGYSISEAESSLKKAMLKAEAVK